MALNFTLFPSATSLEGGLIRSLTVTAQDRVKTLVAGDTEPTTIQIRGTDGNAINPTGYSIRVGIGGLNLRPTAGSGTINDGTQTITANFDTTAAQLQTLLNAMNSGAGYDSAGDCVVTGNVGGPYFVVFDDPGAVDLPTLNAEGFTPKTLASAVFTQEGDVSTRAGFVIRFFQEPLVYQEAWTNNGTNTGVTGEINLGTEGVYRLLPEGTTQFASFIEFELTDPDGNVSTVARQNVTVTGEVIGRGAGGTTDFSNLLTETEAAALYQKKISSLTSGEKATVRSDLDVTTVSDGVDANFRIPTGNIIVAGAGTAAANGTYEPDGTFGGKARFTKTGGTTGNDSIQWDTGTSAWLINNDALIRYGSFDDVATPDLVTTWTEGASGTAPVPTVTAETSLSIPTHVREFANGTTIAESREAIDINVYRGQFHFSTPAATTIAVAGTFVKAAGTTTSDALVGMTHADNRLTNTSGETRRFLVQANISATVGISKVINLRLTKDGATIAATQVDANSGAHDMATIGAAWMIELANNEYVELWIANETDTSNVTVTHGTLTAYSIDG